LDQSKLPLSLRAFSVLPDNRSALERALELSLSNRVYGVENPYPALLDADNTSLGVVPYLASERQLPIWDASDSEEVKRKLAGNAWKVRRLSGTSAGLSLALDSLGFLSEIVPWHKQSPRGVPYSLEVIAWEQGNKPVDVDNVFKLMAYIEEAQSERDQVELSLMFGVSVGFGLSVARAPVTNVRELDVSAELWPMPEVVFSCAVTVGALVSVNVSYLDVVAVVPEF